MLSFLAPNPIRIRDWLQSTLRLARHHYHHFPLSQNDGGRAKILRMMKRIQVHGAPRMSHAPLVTATSARDTSGRRVNGARCVAYREVGCHLMTSLTGYTIMCSFSFVLSLLSTQTWKRRWFVLRHAHLAYYKTSAEYQLHRLLDLQEVHTCTPVALKRRENTFGVVTATRTYYLQAESQEDARAWVVAIREAKEAQLASTTSTAPVSTTSTLPIPIPG